MSSERGVPEGFVLVTKPTAAAGKSYTVDVLQAESLDAIRAVYEAEGKSFDEIMLALWNSGNEQGAKQGQKEQVRKAVEAGEGVDEAVAAHQAAAAGFIQGAPRGGGGGTRHESGLTKKQREALGTAVALEMARTGAPPTKARMVEIAVELGIDPAGLGG